MIDCLILGDSLAVGVGQARPGCTTVARTGINSTAFVQTLLPGAPAAAASVVISLGVNDAGAMPTLETLRTLRGRLSALQVTWLLPGVKEDVRRAIRLVAAERGDRVLDTAGVAGPDHIHPSREGYRLLAGLTGGAPQAPGSLAPPVMSGPVLAAGTTLRWKPAPPPGSAYNVWPPPQAIFAAIPPSSYAYRAILPLPAISQH